MRRYCGRNMWIIPLAVCCKASQHANPVMSVLHHSGCISRAACAASMRVEENSYSTTYPTEKDKQRRENKMCCSTSSTITLMQSLTGVKGSALRSATP